MKIMFIYNVASFKIQFWEVYNINLSYYLKKCSNKSMFQKVFLVSSLKYCINFNKLVVSRVAVFKNLDLFKLHISVSSILYTSCTHLLIKFIFTF